MLYTLKDKLEKKSEYLGICFDTQIRKNGALITIPTTPAASENLPAKKEGITTIFLPVNIMNAGLEAMKEVFNGKVTSGETVQATATPTFALEEDRGTLTVPVQMEDPAAGCVLTMDIIVRVTFEVQEEKLKTIMEIDSVNNFVQVSGDTDETTQNEMANAAVSFWNAQLPPICLPNLLGATYGDAPAQIIQGNLVLSVGSPKETET